MGLCVQNVTLIMGNYLQSSNRHPQATKRRFQRVDHQNNKSHEAFPGRVDEHTLEAACLQVSVVDRHLQSDGRNPPD